MDSNTNVSNQPHGMHLPRVKTLLIGAVLLGLIGVVIFAVLREKSISSTSGTSSAGTGYSLEPMRPPLTAAEEAYASALWPIHSEVKLSAVNMTFAGLYYKLGELDLNGLKSKLKPIAEHFEGAASRFRRLQPPASMKEAHQDYAEALRLYQESIAEMVKVVDDGRDEHLIAAQAQSQRAATILIKLSDELWPGEYKPN